MISMKELNRHNYPVSDEVQKSLEDLLSKLNQIRLLYARPMIISSGLRSEADQKRINPKAPKSKHLLGQAADIADSSGELWLWLMDHMDLLKSLGLYLEDKASTPTWVHIQTVPPRSGNRIFKP